MKTKETVYINIYQNELKSFKRVLASLKSTLSNVSEERVSCLKPNAASMIGRSSSSAFIASISCIVLKPGSVFGLGLMAAAATRSCSITSGLFNTD